MINVEPDQADLSVLTENSKNNDYKYYATTKI